MNCPNLFPTIPSVLRLAVIGESPSKDDHYSGQPFSGASGRFLAALLSRAGISRESCYLGNIRCSDDISADLYQLKQDLAMFKPNLIVCLDNAVLNLAKDPLNRTSKTFNFKTTQWRGSIFMAEKGSPFEGFKCISTYSPAYCLRDYDMTAFLQLDLRKAVMEAASPLIKVRPRKVEINLSDEEICKRFQDIRLHKRRIAPDLEGYVDSMSVIGFATDPEHAFVVDYQKASPLVWRETALTLSDPDVPKILMNGFYDSFIWSFCYGIELQGYADDIQIKHWGLYSELAKDDRTMSDSESAITHKKTHGKGGMGLAIQASLYTDQPYWKFDKGSHDRSVLMQYCGIDCCVTYECWEYQEDAFNGKNGWLSVRRPNELELIKQQYKFNSSLIPVFRYMIRKGIKYGSAEAATRRALLRQKLFECQAKFNALTGYGFNFKSLQAIKDHAKSLFYTKKGDRCRKEYIFSEISFKELLMVAQPSLATIGELEDLCEVSLNVSSNKQLIPFLYETLKLPTQYKIVRGAPEGTTPPTADYEALLKLSRWCIQNDKPDLLTMVQAIIEIRSLDTRQQMLSISADRDGRIRCGYNLVGTNTGRISCYESPTGSGYNLQTIPNYQDTKDAPGGVLGDRDLFVADDGHWLFQCDLAGADGWTVAAYCAMLGDRAMLDDYLAGIKPYVRIALKVEGRPEADWKDRRELAAFLSTYKLRPIPKLTAKRVQHGGAYLEGGLTISRNILKDSEGKVYWSPTECDKLKNWYIREKYWGIPKWHDFIGRRIRERPVLTAASGQVRQFFGRPDDILTKAVAFEPQANTTYATNLAAYRLWSDQDNRISQRNTCRLKIEPLHQVHDALIGQFKKIDTAWAVSKIQSYFANTLVIANQQITIPFDGAYVVGEFE